MTKRFNAKCGFRIGRGIGIDWSRRIMQVHEAVFAAVMIAGGASETSVAANVPLDDSAQGMTCHFYSAGAKLSWQKKGGDWVDAKGRPYGSAPYATRSVAQRGGLQVVEFDITNLARAWANGVAPVGAVFLRKVAGGKGGIVTFNSREHPAKATHPAIVVTWADGRRSRLLPNADTYFRCPTYRSSGSEHKLSVGGRDVAVLVFRFDAPQDHQIESATLVLTSEKQYGGGEYIGVFQTLLPSSEPTVTRQGIAEQFLYDQQIETHPDVILAESFESRERYESWVGDDEKYAGEIVTKDSSNLLDPLRGRALRVTIPENENTGLNTHFRFAERAEDEPEEAYFRYYLRLGESWNPSVQGGKLPGFSGTYGRAGWGMRKSDGHNGWSARGAFFKQTGVLGAGANRRGIGSYVYHAEMHGNSGDTWGWNLGPSGLLEKNRWYSVEQYVRLNAPGKADGILRAWVNGELVFDRNNIHYRDTDELKIESVWINVFHGGMRPAPADMTLFIDNLVVAHKYIGPMRTSP